MTNKDYLASFEILSADFRRLAEYVEPSDANLSTYSYRLYELLLRASTDFESGCKHALLASGYSKRTSSLNIHDYKTLEPALRLEEVEVGILLWRPATTYVRPYEGWSTAEPPLSWYRSYNRVKHNRADRFAEASLQNVRLALSGLFALLARLNVFDDHLRECHEPDTVEYFYFDDFLFSLRVPGP